MASVISSMGLGSGIDINSLVTNLVNAEQAPVTQKLNKREAADQAKLTAFGTIKGALADFRSSLAGLSKLGNTNQRTATSSDTSSVTVTADSNADLGNYRLEVKQLAQGHAVASTPFATVNAPVGTGTLTIKLGTYQTEPSPTFVQNPDKGTLSLTIDSSNNTLSGIRDAINKADAGISAAIVYNGSGYQLVLNSEDGGVKNAMQITGIAGLQYTSGTVAGDTMTQTQAAKDAIVSINGLDVHSTSNTVSNALKGVTLNLLKAEAPNTQTLVNVDISQGSADSFTKPLQDFVKSYNDLYAAVKSVASYNAATKTAGPLLGDSVVQGAMAMVRSQLTQPVSGLTGSIRSLVDIGLRTQADGTLSLDTTKLKQAVSTDRDSVAAVFAVLGRPGNTGVQYTDATSATKTGSYAVNVTHAATQGFLTGNALAAPFPLVLTGAGNDNTFSISVDGVNSDPIALTPNTYANGDALATEIQARINGDSKLRTANVSVSVALDAGNHLVITSKSFGSSSNVSVTQANSALGLTVGSGSTAGSDIAGTIGGLEAEGKGQQLSAISGDASGLKLLIGDNTAGDKGAVSFSRGLTERLDKALGSILNTNGSVSARLNGLQKDLDRIQSDRDKLAERMSQLQRRLIKQFTAMDSLVGQLQSTGSYLAQQLSNLPNSNSSN
ncbi:flagellar filament capping protein FliD [Methylococcus sp. EFPC2]|uniref:flagellar filament capping protein FliD n=1 Tax=Methylococcus sp. EFPC2 TaxID=2812648 RepID=UPI001967556B|nr:flagellar filament capping protein FliD [Methylococcus sp. EFPC2]QSA95860.1 flagellar filament capping protein FliD [Methylococcus sp. EFPC2]